MYARDHQRARTEIACRIMGRLCRAADAGIGPPLDEVLNDVIYHEQRRLEGEPKSRETAKDLFRLKEHARALLGGSTVEVKRALEEYVHEILEEIQGNFNPTMIDLTTRLVPGGLSLLLNALSPGKLAASFPNLPDIKENIHILGEVAALKSLASRGTLIVTPTHQSNLDSIVMGYALWLMGLPPFTYGAGLNLFSNPLMGFFLSNLGAYTVDRKKKHQLYKDILKEYATVTLEFGYNNLFFPGGTRSRSGRIEERLKLGLLGCGLSATINNLKAGRPNPNVFIVPATITFDLVLEAETLIDDHLKEEGKSRYIITDDEFSRPRRIFQFLSNLISLDSQIYVTFSKPLDPFGNEVTSDGVSLDRLSRPIDTSRYTWIDGVPEHDSDRDREYTEELGQAVRAAFHRDNIVLSTHLLAFALFELLRRKNPGVDLYRLLRTGGSEPEVPVHEVRAVLLALVEEVRAREARGQVRLIPVLAEGPPEVAAEEALSRGLRFFSTYHTTPAVERRGDRVIPADLELCYYYHNRLDCCGLGNHG